MEISRRCLLGNATVSAAAVMFGKGIGDLRNGSAVGEPGASVPRKLHPLTRSLLGRARSIGRGHVTPDRVRVERTIQQFADQTGRQPLVIKWMDTPSDAFDHLSRFGLDALLDMGSACFWRWAQPPASHDEETFERAFEVRMMANQLLGVEEHDRVLMSPKLLAKSRAMSANVSAKEVFRVRAVSSQIGWLETSLADVAAQAVANVELLLSAGSPESSVAIGHQFRFFESYEYGLLATWETTDDLICVPA